MTSLKRKIGFWGVFCIAAGAMISSGLFVLPGIAFELAGPAVVLAYALAGVMVIPAMLCQAELATAMPRSGGTYFFIERSLGAWPGTLAGLANWFSIALKSAFALIGIGACAQLVWPHLSAWEMKAIAVGFCALFTGVNLLSVKGVERVQILMVVVLLAILGLFLFFGLSSQRVTLMHFENFAAKGKGAILATAGMVFVSFGGLTKVAAVAEEIKHPGRNLPAGMFAAAVIVALVYVAVVFTTVGVLGDALSGNLTPLADAANVFLGVTGSVILGIAAMLAFVTTANAGILASSRGPMAMSRDGLLPSGLRRVSKRFGTPHVSILATTVFMVAVIVALELRDLVTAASTMMLVLFVLVNVAVIIMRSSRLQNYRPLYKAPFFPWLQVVGIGVYTLLIVQMILVGGAVPLVVAAAFVVGGTLWYLLYVRARIVRESAFVHMVRNIVSKEIRRGKLDQELLEIALERDEVSGDRFDRIVTKSDILDISGAVTAADLFTQAARALAPRLDTDEKTLFDLFQAREADSSTVIQPGLAIPHIIVDGKDLFDVLMVRCKGGVIFEGQASPVHIAFILIGSRDERNFHLRALMAISHIVGEPEFFKRWMTAPNSEHLRDIVLLSGRQRDVE